MPTEVKVEEYFDEKEWNISESKTFVKFTPTFNVFSQNKVEIKKEYDQDGENEMLPSDTTKIKNEDITSLTESAEESKHLEIGDYKIYCENDLKNYVDNFEIKSEQMEIVKSKPAVSIINIKEDIGATHDNIEIDINNDFKENAHFLNEYDRSTMLICCGGKLFKCNLCGFESKYKAKVELHIKRHKAINKCEDETILKNDLEHDVVCDVKDDYQPSLDSDGSEQDDEKKYKCPHCKYQTDHKGTMNRHLQAHSDSRPYECKVCARQFKQRRHLEDHTFTHTAERRFHCVHCNYKTNRKACLETHFKNEHDVGKSKKYKCSQCHYESNRKSNFNNHLRRHLSTKEKPCKCIQNNNQNYGCSKCEYKINNDMKNEKTFCCLNCNYKTNRKTTLTRHWKNKHSTGERKDFKCSHCQYETNYKRCLDIHLRKHVTGNEKFKCSVCDYQTNVEVYFRTHVKYKHGDVKKQKCPKCKYETNKQYRMNEHLLTHDNFRSYKCKICNKRFKLNHHLITHSLVHSKEKKFHCGSCDYKSNYKTLLLKHENKHIVKKKNK